MPYKPDFCVKAVTEPLETAERLLRDDPRVAETWRDQARLWLRGPLQPVLRVRPHRLQNVHRVATDLRRATATKGFAFFDVDHDPASRWMHRQGLFAMCRLAMETGGPELRLAEGEDRFTLHYPDPELSAVPFGVRVAQRGHLPAMEDDLIAVRLGDEELPCPAPGEPDAERQLLLEVGRRLDRLDPDVLLTRHGDRFDVPYLLARIRRHGLEDRVRLGRDADPVPERPDQPAKSIHTYGRWLYKSHAYYLRGRWHIDLSKKTLDSEDDRKDLHGILYLSRVANRRPQDTNRNGAGYALQQMQIDQAIDLGVSLPWKRNLAEDWTDLPTLCAADRGGQIMAPRPGIYEDVAACDFSGYYPSLVVTHNLSSDTINCTCCPDGPIIPELGYHVCTQVYGHQAEVLRRLWSHRRYVKAILKRAKHGSIDQDLAEKCRAVKSEHKALGVVCFGYFRYRNARFGCGQVHQAIQAHGRAGMTKARVIAQEEGFEMVHMMTDCVFLRKKGVTHAEAQRVARRISWGVGVPMDVEGVYRWIVLLPSKTHSTTSEVGVPNRYYGKFEDGTLKVRGVEVQRHSTPAWIYDVQQGMLDVLGQADDAEEFQRLIPKAWEVAKRAAGRLRRREVDVGELGVMTQSTRSVEDYAANTNTRAAVKRLRDVGVERKPGEYVKFVIARGAGPWDGRVVPVELLDARPRWFDGRKGVSYDVEAYLRLLARSVETLLSPFGYEEEALYEWLAGRAGSPREARAGRLTPPRRPEWVVA